MSEKWMVCTMCRQTVLQNDIGICLHCQRKYDRHNQPDSWDNLHRCARCGRRLAIASEDCGICDGDECGHFSPAFDVGK